MDVLLRFSTAFRVDSFTDTLKDGRREKQKGRDQSGQTQGAAAGVGM